MGRPPHRVIGARLRGGRSSLHVIRIKASLGILVSNVFRLSNVAFGTSQFVRVNHESCA
jgi:hypothetical protein